MANINYKSDFIINQKVYCRDEEGNLIDIGFPKYDFRLVYWTTNFDKRYYEASCHYDKNGRAICKNCKNLGDKLIVIFDNHQLLCGELKVDFEIEIPNDLFPDGYKKEFGVYPTEVNLWDKPSEHFSKIEALAILPYIKGKDGKDFSFEDLTEEQLNNLVKKIAEYVKVDGLEQQINTAVENAFKGKAASYDPATQTLTIN